MMHSRHFIASILLITGTCVGGGMLALPILTSLGGFFPSIIIYFVTWLFMAATGLLFLEVCLWMDKEANIISMAEMTLGRFGKISAWIVYLAFFYTLIVAYISGSQELLCTWLGGYISKWLIIFIFIAIFAPFIYLGARAVEMANIILLLGLAASYVIFIAFGISKVQNERLLSYNIPLSFMAFPVIFTAFGFQGTIPSLVFYLHRNAKVIRLVIIIGSFVPFFIYIVWQWLILGIIPKEGPSSLSSALAAGETAVAPLKYLLETRLVTMVGQLFAFFALTSSLLGVALGFRDFLADGLKIKKTPIGKIFLCGLIFIPPLLLSIYYPNIFLKALDLAGGYGSAYLLGVLPILMVWFGRYKKNLSGSYRLFGGKPLLIVLSLFVFCEIALKTAYLIQGR